MEDETGIDKEYELTFKELYKTRGDELEDIAVRQNKVSKKLGLSLIPDDIGTNGHMSVFCLAPAHRQ
eukprot:12935691-Prorocentrum_lima.AAC.1